jgi:hypothetical protein
MKVIGYIGLVVAFLFSSQLVAPAVAALFFAVLIREAN